jgi:hypothetical protein
MFALYLAGWPLERLHNYDSSWIGWSKDKKPADRQRAADDPGGGAGKSLVNGINQTVTTADQKNWRSRKEPICSRPLTSFFWDQ